ncbi:MAG: hypothetical protein IIV99_00965 [Oscillospiraceae bacterium]|nr:hypothetical protein [Oscillospiraceae bacterium]
MYKQQINSLRAGIVAAMTEDNYNAAVAALNELTKEIPDLFGDNEGFRLSAMSYISEALGDVCMHYRLVTDAEKHYINMVTHSAAAYEIDREKHSYRHGFCFYRRACFYRTMLGIVSVFTKPMELTEQQKKVFELASIMYKSAIGVTYTKDTGIPLLTAQLHGKCMHDLLLLHCAAGDYNLAAAFGKDGINIDSLVYGQTPDGKTAERYARHLSALASVYMVLKENLLAADTAMDAAQIFLKHSEHNPSQMLLQRSKSLTLAARCYGFVSEKAHLCEQLYKDALRAVTDANDAAGGKLAQDVIILYMLTGDFYNRKRKHVMAVEHYRWAYNVALDALNRTGEQRFAQYVDRLRVYAHPE